MNAMQWIRSGAIVGLGLIWGSPVQPALAESDGHSMKQEVSNDSVLVVRIQVAPHGTIPTHEIPPHVTVWLTDADLKVNYPDGKSEVIHHKAGEVTWVTAGKHSGENLGDKPIEFVAVEPRAGGPSSAHGDAPAGRHH